MNGERVVVNCEVNGRFAVNVMVENGRSIVNHKSKIVNRNGRCVKEYVKFDESI